MYRLIGRNRESRGKFPEFCRDEHQRRKSGFEKSSQLIVFFFFLFESGGDISCLEKKYIQKYMKRESIESINLVVIPSVY